MHTLTWHMCIKHLPDTHTHDYAVSSGASQAPCWLLGLPATNTLREDLFRHVRLCPAQLHERLHRLRIVK